MSEGEVIYLAWSDMVGVTRVRGVPAGEISRRMAYGLGWAVAGQALTPFEDIAPNPWGPMLEVRQTPAPDTEVRVDIWPDAPPLHFFMCDSKVADGSNVRILLWRHVVDFSVNQFRSSRSQQTRAAGAHILLRAPAMQARRGLRLITS